MRESRIICTICMRAVLFMSVQCYFCAYSAIDVRVRTALFMGLYFEPFSLNIFNRRSFMPQILTFLLKSDTLI